MSSSRTEPKLEPLTTYIPKSPSLTSSKNIKITGIVLLIIFSLGVSGIPFGIAGVIGASVSVAPGFIVMLGGFLTLGGGIVVTFGGMASFAAALSILIALIISSILSHRKERDIKNSTNLTQTQIYNNVKNQPAFSEKFLECPTCNIPVPKVCFSDAYEFFKKEITPPPKTEDSPTLPRPQLFFVFETDGEHSFNEEVKNTNLNVSRTIPENQIVIFSLNKKGDITWEYDTTTPKQTKDSPSVVQQKSKFHTLKQAATFATNLLNQGQTFITYQAGVSIGRANDHHSSDDDSNDSI